MENAKQAYAAQVSAAVASTAITIFQCFAISQPRLSLPQQQRRNGRDLWRQQKGSADLDRPAKRFQCPFLQNLPDTFYLLFDRIAEQKAS